MIVQIQKDGELIPTELFVENEDILSDYERIWKLQSKEFSHIFIQFKEGGGQLKEIVEMTKDIEDSKEVLSEKIEGFISDEVEKRISGVDDDNDTDEPQPYDYNKISISTQTWSLAFVYEIINDYQDLDLSPDFQRNYVWDYKRKCRLIESLMLKIPVPAFYLSETSEGKYQVVDGLQRLTTINNFMNNKFPLKYLEYLKDDDDAKNQEGKYFKDKDEKKGISPEFRKNIQMTQINVNIIEAKSPAKVKFDVFRRVNTGGKPLNNQEIRNCLANNQTRTLLNDMVRTKAFGLATGNSVKETRMQAQELALRFVGFWYERVLKNSSWRYTGKMTEFLDISIELLNERKGQENQIIEEAFERGMLNAYYLFGQYSFRKCLPKDLESDARRQLINKSLFTTWSIVLSKYEPEIIQSKVDKHQFIYGLAEYLKDDQAYFGAVSYKTNDKESLRIAFNAAQELIDNLIN